MHTELFVWKPSYSVRIDKLDAQHKKLIELINRLQGAVTTGRDRTVVAGVLTELISYSNTHFAEEERRMTACEFRGLKEHMLLHDTFTRRIRRFLAAYQTGSPALTQEVLTYLKSWLVEHIETVDQRYVPALLGQAAA
jgi:hemerythrin-like metal-binding protein